MLFKDYPEGYDLTLMNTVYRYPRKNEETGKWDDGSIDLVVKDNHTGKKFVRTIANPTYRFYMAKDDVKIEHNLFFIEKDKTDEIEVPYKDLNKCIAELTNNEDFYYENIKSGNRRANENLHLHPRVFLSDMNIEDHYMFRFSNEYKNSIIPVTKAFFDIEADTINMMGDFPEMGECPINAVSLINESNNMVYIFLLRNSRNPLIEQFEKSIGPGLIKELKEFITDAVGGWKQAVRFGIDKLNFSFLMYNEDEEIKLIQDLFGAINTLQPDFVLAWNMAFDVPYIIQRIINLGYNPADIMCHPDFAHKEAVYYVDQLHKDVYAERGDFARISSYSVYLDQMIQYASRRKGQSAEISYGLDAIGSKVAKVKKLDYKNITTNLGELPYKDYKTFVFYNIMDTIVQKCIEKKTGDIDFVFNKSLSNNTRYSKCHRQTVYLANRTAAHFYKLGFILGNNINKTNQPEHYAGAFVADPLKTSSYSKMKIFGIPINVYDNLNDFDYARLYPSITQEFNMAPNTQIGKVTFPNQIDPNEHKFPREGWERQSQYMEDLQSGVYLEFAHRWLGLASYDELLEDIAEFFTTQRAPQQALRYYNPDGSKIAFQHIPEGTVNPFIHVDGKPYNPFDHYIVIDNELKEGVLSELRKSDNAK